MTSRDPVSLIDLRAGIESERWTASRLVEEESDQQTGHNAEFSPGGFLWSSPTAPLRGRLHLQVLMGNCAMSQSQKLPIRLHHNAYVTRDQEKTRRFYEDVIGMPLVATWCESDELFGKMRTYCHTFYGMADGGALAFFQFENPKDQEEFGPRGEDAAIAVSSHCAGGGRRHAGCHREAHRRCGHQAAGYLCVLEHRLLPLGLRERSQRADPGIHAR